MLSFTLWKGKQTWITEIQSLKGNKNIIQVYMLAKEFG